MIMHMETDAGRETKRGERESFKLVGRKEKKKTRKKGNISRSEVAYRYTTANTNRANCEHGMQMFYNRNRLHIDGPESARSRSRFQLARPRAHAAGAA